MVQHQGGPISDHGEMTMTSRVTGPEVTAVTVLTLLALGAGIVLAALYGDFSMRSGADHGDMGPMTGMATVSRMGGLIMPPGMIMTADTSMEAMADMAAVDPGQIRYTAPWDARGDQPLEPRIEAGVKIFDLEASIIGWSILPNVQSGAYAFNGQVPGPRIRVSQGDTVRINVRNNLPEATSVHWHGLIVPNEMDGPADVTQPPIEPGQTFVYQFRLQQRGTYFYYSHHAADRQQTLGMYGALIVDAPGGAPRSDYDREVVVQLQEWTIKDGYSFPAMPMEGLLPNFFTINGKAYPSTETIDMKQGERLLIRFIGSNGSFIHPMHVHGGPFKIIETDGNPVPSAAQIEKDTVNVGPGERYDVIWTAREPGRWLLHCHILHHTTNNNVEERGGGGLTMIINVS